HIGRVLQIDIVVRGAISAIAGWRVCGDCYIGGIVSDDPSFTTGPTALDWVGKCKTAVATLRFIGAVKGFDFLRARQSRRQANADTRRKNSKALHRLSSLWLRCAFQRGICKIGTTQVVSLERENREHLLA